MEPHTLIAIDPAGPRGKTGIAVFEDGRLVYSAAERLDSFSAHRIRSFLSHHCQKAWEEEWPVYVEEPGDWLRAVKANRTLEAIVQLQRAIGAWQAAAYATPIKDTAVKEAVAGRGNAPKADVHTALRFMGYTFSDGNEADAIALGHYVSSVLTIGGEP